MSEVESRPARGRSSTRGGRGSFGRGVPRGSRKQANGNVSDAVTMQESFEDQGELGEMKKKYLSELSALKDMFPDWTDTDLVLALDEACGDVPSVVDKITAGAVSQFSEVKKPKDRARSKVKEETVVGAAGDKSVSGRSGRNRGNVDSSRGGRGRGVERGRGGFRGVRGGHATTNGLTKDSSSASVPTTESAAWENTNATEPTESSSDNATVPDSTKAGATDAAQAAWANAATLDNAPAAGIADANKSTLIADAGPKKSWASMFAKPEPAAVPALKKAPVTAPAPAPAVPVSQVPPVTEQDANLPNQSEPEQSPLAIEETQDVAVPEHEALAERPSTSEGDALQLTPSKDPLTEENVEHLPDTSTAPATLTAASTTGSIDPRNITPLPQAPIGRPPLGGYATSANRAAGTGGRTASFQRRVKEQQEAVVMPGHSAVDRATVQFGSMGLNGETGLDVDDEREDPETRQAPQHSPPSQPRTSLPPAPRQMTATQEPVLPDSLPTPKQQPPGLPPASAQNQQQIQEPSLGQGLPQEQQMNQYNQYGRYSQPGMQEPNAIQQKHYDPFSHQGQQSQYDQYNTHQQHASQPHQSSFGGLSSAPSDYSSYYTSDQQQRGYHQYYGGSYAPQENRTQASQNHPEPHLGQHRSTSGFGSGHNESAFASQPQQQVPSRFDSQGPGSGNNTPNPVMTGQPQQPSAQGQQQQQNQHSGYGGPNSGYPYGHQYYNSPYPQAYQNQFGFNGAPYAAYGGQNKQGYGGNPYSTNHGMGTHGYDAHSSSPAPGGPFGQNHPQNSGRAVSGSSALGGLDDYNRNGSTQSFGSGMNDPFARSTSGFGGHAYGQQPNMGGNAGAQQDSGNDALKPFGSDTNLTKTGPSPRPASAVTSQQQAAGLPTTQTQQGGANAGVNSFTSGYPGFTNQGQYLGGLGQQTGQSGYGGQSHGGYGTYGAGFNQNYSQYGNARGGGWGQNYSQQH